MLIIPTMSHTFIETDPDSVLKHSLLCEFISSKKQLSRVSFESKFLMQQVSLQEFEFFLITFWFLVPFRLDATELILMIDPDPAFSIDGRTPWAF